ncbi:MAG: hypothetical protein IT364_18275 [Candidatus Hydrogenedentes bacterium]|nr:hypothetical protein [Candidatus Hydrogenedentota bacterium]
MSSASGDVFERLETAIAEWSAEVRSSSAGIALQIARAKERLGDGPERSDAMDRAAFTLESVREETARLESSLRECLAVARDASERGVAAELSIAETREALDSLRNEVAQVLAERPYTGEPAHDAALTEEVKSLRDELAVVRDLAQREPAEPGISHEELNAVRNEIFQLRQEISATREATSRVPELEGILGVERERADRLESALNEWKTSNTDIAHPSDSTEELARLSAEVAELRESLRMPLPPVVSREELDSIQQALEELREASGRWAPRDELGQVLETVRYEISDLREAANAPRADHEQALDELRREMSELRTALHHSREQARESADTTPIHAHGAYEVHPRAADLDLTGFDIDGRRRRMGDILVDAGVISREQLEEALRQQQDQPQRRLGAILVEMGLAEGDIIAQVLACQLKLPFTRLEQQIPEEAAVRLVSGRLASHHRCIPVRVDEDTVVVAMANPMDLIAIEDMELSTGRRVDPVVASDADIAKAIEWFYGGDH